MPRRILVTGAVGQYQLIERRADNEEELQTVLLDHPQLLPAEDLGLDGELMVVGRETTLASGSIDLLCLSRSGDIVIVEFKTGPQNPDFRHALAQLIDYGSDLWTLNDFEDFDEGVVRRYLASKYVAASVAGATTLREAAARTWDLGDADWEALVLRVNRVLSTGDFFFAVAAQRFTQPMKDSVDYLNSTCRYGKYFLIELVRLDGENLKAYAAQVVQKPTARSATASAASRASEADFLGAIADPEYREAVRELFATSSALGLMVVWYSKGASIRLKSRDRHEPLSIGWVFLDGGQWYGARHVTLGVDPSALQHHPSLVVAVTSFCDSLKDVAGGKPTPGSLTAVTFEPDTFSGAKAQLLQLLSDLKSRADDFEG